MNKNGTLQAVEMLTANNINENLKKKYGTSVNEYMSREHSKEVLQQINTLRNLFAKYGKSKNDTLTIEELKDFLSKINVNTQNNITQEEVIKILNLLKMNPNEEITVSQFIQEYISFEDKLKIDNKKYEKALDELTQQINKCQEKIINSSDEIEISDGLTNKSSLFITVIEARDLIFENLNLIGDSKLSVTLKFQGEEQETNMVMGSQNPTWCENFKFKVQEPNGLLIIEVLDNNNLKGKKSLGIVTIDINDLKDQKKRLNWYDLNNESNPNCGSICLKLNCIINFKHFYQSEIETAENQMKIIQNAINITDYYVENLNGPFGLLFSDNLENLINNQELKQADDLINYLESQKEKEKDSIYKMTNGPFVNNMKQGKMKLTLNKLNKVLIYCLVIFSFISLLERSDYINLCLSFLVVYFLLINKNWDVIKYIMTFILLLGITIAFDIFWFFIQFNGFFIGDERDPESGIKRLIYFIGICSCVIKSLIVLSLLNLKKRKNVIDSQEQD